MRLAKSTLVGVRQGFLEVSIIACKGQKRVSQLCCPAVVSFCHTTAGASPSSFGINPQKKLSNTNSENNNNSLLMCFQSSPQQKPMGDMFGVCLLYFSLVPSGNMYTYVHIDSYAHAHFNSVLSNSRKTTHVFFLKVSKNNKQISVFGCLVDLSLWNYSQRFGSLKNRKKQMYVYKHICSMFLFSGT